jgi:hypothetical protein
MELSFQVLLVQIQYAGRRKQKLFPIAHDGFGDLTSTTVRLKIVTTSNFTIQADITVTAISGHGTRRDQFIE